MPCPSLVPCLHGTQVPQLDLVIPNSWKRGQLLSRRGLLLLSLAHGHKLATRYKNRIAGAALILIGLGCILSGSCGGPKVQLGPF